jgi:hypothetical protein
MVFISYKPTTMGIWWYFLVGGLEHGFYLMGKNRKISSDHIWLVVWNHGILWLSIQLGMPWSQLTNSYFSEGWVNHQPVFCRGDMSISSWIQQRFCLSFGGKKPWLRYSKRDWDRLGLEDVTFLISKRFHQIGIVTGSSRVNSYRCGVPQWFPLRNSWSTFMVDNQLAVPPSRGGSSCCVFGLESHL